MFLVPSLCMISKVFIPFIYMYHNNIKSWYVVIFTHIIVSVSTLYSHSITGEAPVSLFCIKLCMADFHNLPLLYFY